jgi:hypothetical protein
MLTFHGLPHDFTENGLSGFLNMVASTEGCLGIAKGLVLEEIDGKLGMGSDYCVGVSRGKC